MILNDIRELVYTVTVDAIDPLPGYDRVESAHVGGWRVVTRKGVFKPGDIAVYFEIDSKVPAEEPFMFLEAKHFKIKTQKMCKSISQGLLMSLDDFCVDGKVPQWVADIRKKIANGEDATHIPLTAILKVTYSTAEDNARKANVTDDKYKKMAQRKPQIFKRPWAKWLMKRAWGRKLMFLFFGRKKDKSKTAFPTKFPYIHKTDQERVENMTWVLDDKTPLIKTQKCDGSSGTFILERLGRKKFEFYVCSRNVRQLTPDQKCYYGDNYYWEVAIRYDIENKLKDYLMKHPELDYVCWQGEVCGPGIQGNPHSLSHLHLFCFHMIDSEKGKYDIREAKKIWDEYEMESVPIVCDSYVLPNDFEELKRDATGYYDPSVCEGKDKCAREGFVYYRITDPNFSFKNVSQEYLLSHH